MHLLSARLRAIADLCPPGLVVADIGSDHGLLPLALLRAGRAPSAIAVDLHPGPLAQLRARAAAEPRLGVRAGDGLAPLSPGEAQVLVLAGIGGRLALRILDAAPAVWMASMRLIVQVNEGSERLRAALRTRGVPLVAQTFVVEGGRAFFTDAYAPQQDADHRPDGAAALLVGARLLADPPAPLRDWVQQERARIVALLSARGPEADPALRLRYAALLEAEERWTAAAFENVPESGLPEGVGLDAPRSAAGPSPGAQGAAGA